MSSVKGFIELKQSSYDFANGLEDAVIKSLENIGRLATQNIKRDAPVDTGFMRDEVAMEKPDQKTVRIVANADYSIYVDKGHETVAGTIVPPNPFFSKEVQRLKDGEFERTVKFDVIVFIKSKIKV